jgi:iron complex outermembrane receptor protein
MGRSDQFGGSPIYRYVDNENLMRVTASAGSGDVALPSYASLGPIVDYITATPSADRGGASARCSAATTCAAPSCVSRGQVGGLTGYVSGSVIDGGLWRGPGTIHREHYEGKLRYEFAQGADLIFQTVHNDYFDYDSPSITKLQYAGQAGDIFGRSGRNFAYLGYVPLPGAAGSAATGTSLPAVAGGPPYSNANYNQYYKFAVNSRQDHLYGLTLNLPVNDAISASATAYYEDKGGYGVSPEAYATSLTNYNAERLIVPGLTAPRGIQYGLSGIDGIRKGVTGHADFETGMHLFSVGGWVEKDDYHRTQARYNVANGHPDGEPLFNEPVHLQKNFVSTRETVSFFVKDTISLLDDALKLELGFKGLDIDYTISGKRCRPTTSTSALRRSLTTGRTRSCRRSASSIRSAATRCSAPIRRTWPCRAAPTTCSPSPAPPSRDPRRRRPRTWSWATGPTGRRSTPRSSSTRPSSRTGCSRSPRRCRAPPPPRPSSRMSAG